MSIPWLVLVSFFIVLVALTSSQDNNSTRTLEEKPEGSLTCDIGWYPYENLCYSLGSAMGYTPQHWLNADQICSELGGKLVSIHSKELNYFLEIYMLNRVKKPIWIGLRATRRIISQYLYTGYYEQYFWEDQRSINYTNWADGDTFGGYQEVCVVMDFGTGNNRKNWRRKPNWESHDFICQKEKKSSMSSYTDPRLCKDGGWKKDSSCFYLIESPLTWYEAEEYCVKTHSGHLATVLDFTTNSFLHYVFSAKGVNAWLGIRINCSTFQQKWSSGWFLSYSNWRSEDPTECTAITNDARWLSVSCNVKLPFICETSSVSPPMMTPSSIEGAHCPKIPKRWRDLGGDKCYHFETENLVPWPEANFQCLRMGGTLTSIHSRNESEVLNQFMVGNLYIGLHRSAGHGDGFIWSDGTPVDYINWSQNKPNDTGEECVVMAQKDIRWSDIPCSVNRGYICSVQKIGFEMSMAKEAEPHKVVSKTNMAKETESHKGGVSILTLLGVMFCVLCVCILFGMAAYYNQWCYRKGHLTYKIDNNQYEHVVMIGKSEIEFSGVSN